MRGIGLVVLVRFLILLVYAGPAAAALWVPNGVTLCSHPDAQSGPLAVSDGAGGAIVAWLDTRGDGLPHVIYARRVDASGAVLWTTNGVAVSADDYGVSDPAIIADGAGGAIIAWESSRNAQTFSLDINAQRVNAAGQVVWTAGDVEVCAELASQSEPVMVSDGAGGAIIAWQDLRDGGWDIYAQRVTAAGTALWAANGVPICTAANNQIAPAIVTDGAGGAIIAWQDGRNGADDIYAQRVVASGTRWWIQNGHPVCAAAGHQSGACLTSDNAGGAIVAWVDERSGSPDIYVRRMDDRGYGYWSLNGLALCEATGAQLYPAITTDGAGGAIVAWTDFRAASGTDIYARRVTFAGDIAWAPDGVPLCTRAGHQLHPAIISTGAGGAIVAWDDVRDGQADIYVQRLASSGAVAWVEDGLVLCKQGARQVDPALASDGADGGFVAWADARNGLDDIYAQHVDAGGRVGDLQPTIAAIQDVPGDQGGRVRISIGRSPQDAAVAEPIARYSLWRRIEDPPPGFARLPGPFPAGAWEIVGGFAACQWDQYTYRADTLADSTASGIPHAVYVVSAHFADPLVWYVSYPDSGYSVDDIAPAVPEDLRLDTGEILTWRAATDADFEHFAIHGSGVDHLDGGESFIGRTTGNTCSVAGLEHDWFLVTATDRHGNRSAAAALAARPGPSGAPPVRYALHPCRPNPFNPRTSIRFDLPQATSVSLKVYDVAGHLVRTLADGLMMPAGRREVGWQGCDDSGRPLASGTYHCRLEAGSFMATMRMALVR